MYRNSVLMMPSKYNEGKKFEILKRSPFPKYELCGDSRSSPGLERGQKSLEMVISTGNWDSESIR